MISVGTGVHKKRCVTAIRDGSGRTPEKAAFENGGEGTGAFVRLLGRRYGGGENGAVCEPTADCRIRVHDMPEDHGTGSAPVRPAKAGAMAHAGIKDGRVDANVPADPPRADMFPRVVRARRALSRPGDAGEDRDGQDAGDGRTQEQDTRHACKVRP